MSEKKGLIAKDVDKIALDLLEKRQAVIKLDPEYFLDLLRGSLSLSTAEKKRVLDAVPDLIQFQFDELTKVFEDERAQFKASAHLDPEYVKNLVIQRKEEWIILGEMYESEFAANAAKDEDQGKIDDIKKSLGL